MAKINYYPATGFLMLTQLVGGLKTYEAAIVNIAKGDALHDNGSGLATNATTALAATFLGIAIADVDNSGDDNLNVQVIPALPRHQFVVAVEENAVITQAAISTLVNLQSVNTIDISDTLTEGWVFMIDEIDISAAALAINTNGFAIGHFKTIGTQA